MAYKEEKSTEKHTAQISHLPPLKELWQAAWALFRRTIFSYLKLLGLLFSFFFLAGMIGLVFTLPVTFSGMGAPFQVFQHPTPFHIITLILLIIWAICYLVMLVAISIAMPIASIEILQEVHSAQISTLLKRSKRLFVPYCLTSLLVGLLIIGGMMVILLPGLLIAFFFLFVPYEIVIGQQSGSAALRRSYFMVKNHFWEVLSRVLLLEIGILLVSSLCNRFAKGDVLLTIVSVLFSLFAGWFIQAYLFLLYKQVKARTAFEKSVSIRWIWIVSLIGWLLLLCGIVAVVVGLAHIPTYRPTQVITAGNV